MTDRFLGHCVAIVVREVHVVAFYLETERDELANLVQILQERDIFDLKTEKNL